MYSLEGYKYLIFGGKVCEYYGGWNDYQGKTYDYSTAVTKVSVLHLEWWQIIDLYTMKVIISSVASPIHRPDY